MKSNNVEQNSFEQSIFEHSIFEHSTSDQHSQQSIDCLSKPSNQPLTHAYKLALVDLDGVVYVGKNPIEYASQSLQAATKKGMYVEYTTNNSSRYQSVVAEQLRGFGLEVEPWQVITSSVVAARMVAHHVPAGSPVLAIGAPHLLDEVRKAGLTPVDGLDQKPVAVIQGWYPEITWNELALAAFAVEQGAAYYVTNRDLTIPREHGIAPGCGSLIQAVMNATGVEPVQSAGKPESGMYDEARGLVAEHSADVDTTNTDTDSTYADTTSIKTLVSPSQQVASIAVADCLAVGDRLDTDIEAGNRGGYDSLLVLTGVTDAKQVLLAEPILRPTYIARDLRGLHQIHELPVAVEQHEQSVTYQCGYALVTLDEHGFHTTIQISDTSIESSVDDISQLDSHHMLDPLRAACAASWYAKDHQMLTADQLEKSVEEFCTTWYPNGRDCKTNS